MPQRLHVGEAGAGEARLQVREPARGGVESVEPPVRVHEVAEQQRLAAGAGAEVDHQVAALRCDQQPEQLAAFVLHLDRSRAEQLVPVDGRVSLAGAHRAVSRRGVRALMPSRTKRASTASRVVFIRFTRRSSGAGSLQAARQREQCGLAEPRQQPVDQPVRQIAAQRERQLVQATSHAPVEPVRLGRVDERRELPAGDAAQFREAREHQAARVRAARQMFEQALAPQAGEHGLGDEGPVAGTEPRVVAKEGAQHGVRGLGGAAAPQ